MRLKLSVFLLCCITHVDAAVIVKLVTEDGEQKIVATKPQQVTKNCEPATKEIIMNRANWLHSGAYDDLYGLYESNASINHTTNLLNQKELKGSYLISKFIQKLKKSRSEQEDYLFLQLNGHCQHKDGQIIYSGLEVEKLDFEGFGPMIATTHLKVRMDGETHKIKSEQQKVNIQQWNIEDPNQSTQSD